MDNLIITKKKSFILNFPYKNLFCFFFFNWKLVLLSLRLFYRRVAVVFWSGSRMALSQATAINGAGMITAHVICSSVLAACWSASWKVSLLSWSEIALILHLKRCRIIDLLRVWVKNICITMCCKELCDSHTPVAPKATYWNKFNFFFALTVSFFVCLFIFFTSYRMVGNSLFLHFAFISTIWLKKFFWVRIAGLQ